MSVPDVRMCITPARNVDGRKKCALSCLSSSDFGSSVSGDTLPLGNFDLTHASTLSDFHMNVTYPI